MVHGSRKFIFCLLFAHSSVCILHTHSSDTEQALPISTSPETGQSYHCLVWKQWCGPWASTPSTVLRDLPPVDSYLWTKAWDFVKVGGSCRGGVHRPSILWGWFRASWLHKLPCNEGTSCLTRPLPLRLWSYTCWLWLLLFWSTTEFLPVLLPACRQLAREGALGCRCWCAEMQNLSCLSNYGGYQGEWGQTPRLFQFLGVLNFSHDPPDP